jgi:MFS family permease
MNTKALSTAQPEGFFSWFYALTGKERRTFWSCKIGYALDAMDTQFLSFVIPTLIATWGLSKGDAGLIGTVTLLTSARRRLAAGVLSDRIGRVKTLQITILWFAVFTLAVRAWRRISRNCCGRAG